MRWGNLSHKSIFLHRAQCVTKEALPPSRSGDQRLWKRYDLLRRDLMPLVVETQGDLAIVKFHHAKSLLWNHSRRRRWRSVESLDLSFLPLFFTKICVYWKWFLRVFCYFGEMLWLWWNFKYLVRILPLLLVVINWYFGQNIIDN